MQKGALLPVFYLGPIEYFSAINSQTSVVKLEKFEHFPKQTYRNRASIYSPNGILDLIVPVKKGANNHSVIKDVRISYDADWQRLHWRSLQTAYRSSSFFEFYEDDFAPFYHQKTTFLYDFNLQLLKLCLNLLKINASLEETSEYIKTPADYEDVRNAIHPKNRAIDRSSKQYFQVFSEKNGFIPSLSIVDLLFNQGPQSKQYL